FTEGHLIFSAEVLFVKDQHAVLVKRLFHLGECLIVEAPELHAEYLGPEGRLNRLDFDTHQYFTFQICAAVWGVVRSRDPRAASAKDRQKATEYSEPITISGRCPEFSSNYGRRNDCNGGVASGLGGRL